MTEFIPENSLFTKLPSPFTMKRGSELIDARMAYETWGQLNADASNAILILTGLSPNAHAATNVGNSEAGWWEAMLGPGKAIDTHRWFVICVNSLGSCKGSTGPASVNPLTNKTYCLDFPELSIEDGANAAFEVVKALGISQLACVIGNSMGGMTALAYLLLHPGSARSHINVSGSARALPFSIAIRSLQREAIRLDPHWNQGQYTDELYPENGMRMARKLGVVTYRSAMEWDGRFGRVRFDSEFLDEDPFSLEFEVERYLEGHARRFVRQFDPNCYLYLSRSMDWFDAADYGQGDAMRALASIKLDKALSIGVHTDILFPLQQQEQIAEGLRASGCEAEFAPLPSPQGHDAFLVDIERFSPAIAGFLAKL
ncbi:MAG: homoserine O-acetyltransferase MetX [Arenimonas sp.]